MATLVVDDNDLIVRLSKLEKLGSWRTADIRVPRGAVKEVRFTEDAWSELRGLRWLGTGLPRLVSLCVRRHGERGERRDFVAVYRHRPAVVVDTDGAKFDRLVVSCRDAAKEAQHVREQIPDLS